jgi:hypothetical protein
MNPALSNIRGTFFTNKPVEIDYEKSMKIVTALQSYQLFPFPVNGFSFQIGPNGMIPATLTSYEFRNSNNSINISIGPDRIDVNLCKLNDNFEQAYRDCADFCLQALAAFHSCVDFKETRLALASTWILTKDNLDAISERYLQPEPHDNLIEWDNRRVERRQLQSIGVPVNYGHKIARSQIKLPIEQVVADRIFVETDINTIPLPPDVLNAQKDALFFDNAVEASKGITSDYFNKMNL